jgi:hypothetical protein
VAAPPRSAVLSRRAPAQFRLLGPDRKPIGGLQKTFHAGTLQPAASVSGQLKYPAPRDGSRRFIEYREAGGAEPVVIDLSPTGAMTPDTAFEHFSRPPPAAGGPRARAR